MNIKASIELATKAETFGWNPELDEAANAWMIRELYDQRVAYERKPNTARAHDINVLCMSLINFIEAQKV